MKQIWNSWIGLLALVLNVSAEDAQKPYAPPVTEREAVFEFTEKPQVKNLGSDKYEITFAVKGNCDVTVGLIDSKGNVVRHLASGVLGANAPAPFQKNSLKQVVLWNGKDDLDGYVKEPGGCRVQVRLGLQPEFDKLLLGKSPKNLSPAIWGIAVGPDGAYVFSNANGSHPPGDAGHLSCRKFDHDGNYVGSLLPPGANLPLEKLGGFGFIEYEPGVRALHGVPVQGTIHERGHIFVTTDMGVVSSCQPFILGQKLHFFGVTPRRGLQPVFLHRMNTDGSTTAQEISVPLGDNGGRNVSIGRLTASPDGKWLYLVAAGYQNNCTAVMRAPLTGGEPAKVFVGNAKAVGSDNQHFQDVIGLDCDATGRLYVGDRGNNRIQIYSADGKHLRTLPVDRPELVRVHPKTGALYVVHQARVEGKSRSRVTKFTSFDAPVEEWHADDVGNQALAVDAWTARTRLWVGSVGNVVLYEEDGKKLNKVADFAEEAKKEEGGNYIGQWGGFGENDKVVCDPVQEHVYFKNTVFDLKTGALLKAFRVNADDIAFDKRGYLHCHFNPGFYQQGVGRLDPKRSGSGPGGASYLECPYDYGCVGKDNWTGIIPTKCQPGAKFFQDGVGVNMQGDVVVQSNIYYAPKMTDDSETLMLSGPKAVVAGGRWNEESTATHDRFIKDLQKAGEEVYSIRRSPGIPLLGGTVFTYNRNGELRQECAVNSGVLINGVQLDEEGNIYAAISRTCMRSGRPFLAGKGGTIGAPGDNRAANPYTGTLLKTSGKGTSFILPRAPVPPDVIPKRPADLQGSYGEDPSVWVEGVAWLYAGVSPIVAHGCSCPTQRFHLDWHGRSFVPEAYRHSFGVLDTAGNLIMHLGKYGNYDSGNGAQSKIPVGGDNIAMYLPRFISGTDNHLAFSDWGERLVVLKIAYQTEECAPVK